MNATHKLPLYQLDTHIDQLEDALVESMGEITPEIESAFADVLEMRADKVEAYIAVIRRQELQADAYDAEIKRLTARKNASANTAQNLKSRLCESMQRRGESEHKTALGKVKLQTSGSVPVVLKVDVEDLPERFQRVTVSADRAAIKEALKDGDAEAMDVAEFGEKSQFIRIY